MSEGASLLEATARFTQGTEASCSEDCSLNVQQVSRHSCSLQQTFFYWHRLFSKYCLMHGKLPPHCIAAARSAGKDAHAGKICWLAGRCLLRAGRAHQPQHQQRGQARRLESGVTHSASCTGMCANFFYVCYISTPFSYERFAQADNLSRKKNRMRVQGEVALLVRDYTGNPVEPSSVTGSIRRGKGAGAGDLTFVSQGQGVYTASVAGLGLSLGTHQCAFVMLP